MEWSHIFGFSAAIVMLFGIYPYIRGIFKGTNKPHVFSWLVWGIVTAIGFAAQMMGGAGAGSWITIVNCLFCFTVALLALKYGEKHITRGDWVAFIAALSAIPLWVYTLNPFWSILLISAIDAVAFYPTVRKSWDQPRQEVVVPYVCSALSFGLSLLAMNDFTFNTSFYPGVLVLLNGAFVMMVFLRRRALPVA